MLKHRWSLTPGFVNGRYHCISVTNMYLYSFLGLLDITPLNCDSMPRGNCVRHVKRGQPVTLCASHTTTPSTIPHGKHVVSVSSALWLTHTGGWQRLYCSNGSCTQNYSHLNYRCHSNVSHSCLTINNAKKKEYSYSLTVYFNPTNLMRYRSFVHFHVTYEGMYAFLYISIKLDHVIIIREYILGNIALLS